MDEWLDSQSVNLTTSSSNPAQCSFFFLLSLSLLAWADICAAEPATWGVGPDVNNNVLVMF